MIKSIDGLEDIACFHGGAFFQAIGEDCQHLNKRHEIINADVLDAWFSPAPGVLSAIHDNLEWIARTSPPTNCYGLIQAIAKHRRIPEQCVLPGAGSSDLIFLAMRHFLNKNSKVLILDPTYGEYSHVCEQVIQCDVTYFQLYRQHNFEVDTVALVKTLTSQSYDMVVMVNPNSPTGQYLDQQALINVIGQVSKDTLFWVDETYIEYVGSDFSLEDFSTKVDNVIVCKSMSKVYALSGFRVAYLSAADHLVEQLRLINPPWSVSLPGQIAAIYALSDPQYYQEKYQQTKDSAEFLYQELLKLGCDVIPGVANFLLMFLPSGGISAAELVVKAQATGLYLRNAENMGKHLNQYAVRIAVKSPEDNRKILQTMQQLLA
jgi:histidinol-phosphate/aromatic aminotransferase/cobyric acid decarboxylase-like protein